MHNSFTVETLKNALLQFERAVRKPIFCNVWWNTLGHTKLIRVTSEEREKRQRLDAIKKKEERVKKIFKHNFFFLILDFNDCRY